ncbi:MAG: VCBS repeat-containing protein [Planctomycetes bacterium]|nr:VCBS repeat-containing protein [Planctomycetota bacterium]
MTIIRAILFLTISGSCFAQDPPLLPHVVVPAANNPAAVVVGDLNHDGNGDLVIANSSSNQIEVCFGNGNGGFGPAVFYTTGNRPVAIALADFNNDGNIDVVTANNNSGKITRLLGTPGGGFGAGLNTVVTGNPTGLTTADLNHDGNADVLVAVTSASGGTSILIGNGTGGFAAPVLMQYGMNTWPREVAAGDINLDGNIDFVASAGSSSTASVFVSLGIGTGSFPAPGETPLLSGAVPAAIALGDINSDGYSDAATANAFGPMGTILLGNGTSMFPTLIVITGANADKLNGVAMGDMTGDGVPEAVFSKTNSLTNSNGVDVIQFAGPAGYNIIFEAQSSGNPAGLSLADFDRDNRLDVAVACAADDVVDVIRGVGNGQLEFNSILQFGSLISSAAYGDLNHDGYPDAALGTGFLGVNIALQTSLNDALGHFYSVNNYFSQTYSPAFVCIADYNEDGNNDVLAIQNQSAKLFVGDGSGGLASQTPIATPNIGAIAGAETGDFNNDGRTDCLVTSGSNNIYLLAGDGSGNFSWSSAGVTGAVLAAMATRAADMSGDGVLDLAVTTYTGFAAAVSDGSGMFPNNANIVTSVVNVQALALGDWNGDGFVDAAVIDYGSTSATPKKLILVNNLSGTGLGAGPIYSITGRGDDVAASDLDGDGIVDIVIASQGTSTAIVRRGDGIGGFGAEEFYFSFGIHRAAPIDLNLDGRIDLAARADDSLSSILNRIGTPAGTSTFGSGTQGCIGAHAITANGPPNINNPNFGILASNAPPFSLGLCIVGNAQDLAGSDIFAIGANLYIDFVNSTELYALDSLSDGSGAAFASAPIPNNMNLIGNTYYASVIFVWSQYNICKLPPLQISSSRGLTITIQP